MSLRFKHPEPITPRTRIWPVFIPFAGCKQRCVFCAQTLQTGQAEQSLNTTYEQLADDMEQACANNTNPMELAFFGGTFTALPDGWPERFLKLVTRYKEKGFLTKIRCSTRPDAIEEQALRAYKTMGLDMVELGVQSFNDVALTTSKRGYEGETAINSCGIVKKCGLELGVQLMPGMPGQKRRAFLEDIRITSGIQPNNSRLYPCVVLGGTPLARTWKKGEYTPWKTQSTIAILSTALLELWSAKVRVLRVGLAQEQGLQENTLAGPWLNDMGSRVRALALYRVIRQQLKHDPRVLRSITIPRRYAGELWGHKKMYQKVYAKHLGIVPEKVSYWEGPDFIMDFH